MHVFTIRSPFNFGDQVQFVSSLNGSGKGRILEVALAEDGSIYYLIETDEGRIIGGILPTEVQLQEKV